MSLGYQAVGWNPQKRRYDAVLVGALAAYLTSFVLAGALLQPQATAETLLIRAFGSAAFVLLFVVLSIGPLCRLDRRFLPLLYNRRHLGVVTFLVAAVHGGFSLLQFHSMGDVNPLVSLLTSNPRTDSLAWFPFQPLGFAALVVLFLMAATSHDFWLANLGPRAWKRLHMLVYAAWAVAVAHVVLGALQAERSPLLAVGLGLGVAWVLGLHLVAGWRERAGDRERAGADRGEAVALDGFVDVCAVEAVPFHRAHVATLGGERVAVFRHEGGLSAIANVCRHQQGPLGEGRILDGCVTCPWHGYQYRPEDGCSPPPFTERVATYDVAVRGGRVLVRPEPHSPGTFVAPAAVAPDAPRASHAPHAAGAEGPP